MKIAMNIFHRITWTTCFGHAWYGAFFQAAGLSRGGISRGGQKGMLLYEHSKLRESVVACFFDLFVDPEDCSV